MRNGEPGRAHVLAPYDGRITAALAASRFAADPSSGQNGEAARLAERALRQDATAVRAVVTLGLQAQVRGDLATARRIFAYAQKLSRRDLQTQLWAVEDAVQRGDIDGALRHYDIALRTSKSAPDLLFPVLSAAISDEKVRAGLVALLAERPPWESAFVGFAADKGSDPRAIGAFLIDLRRAGVPVPAGAMAAAVDKLFTQGAFDAAWRFYSAMRPQADRRRSRDPRFNVELSAPSLFDWVLISNEGVSGSIQRGAAGGVFDFAVPPAIGGVLLQQRQLLPPGRYRLEGRGIGIEQPPRSRPYWTLTCPDGRELGRIEMPNSSQGDGVFTGYLIVPVECQVQTLSLVARSTDVADGVSGQIEHVQLTPVS